MQNDISKVTLTITVNHTRNTITVKRAGDRRPITQLSAVSPAALSAAYRDAADYLLLLASEQSPEDGGKDAQLEHMRAEHLNPISGEYN